jgi:hypothetical protein
MMNILTWVYKGVDDDSKRIVSVVIPRSKHRPECYNAEGEDQILVSPGAIDMGGLIITPREQDFKAMTPSVASDIIKEVGISQEEEMQILKRLKGIE